MNIKDILRMAGYDVLEENVTNEGNRWKLEYEIKFKVETRNELKGKAELTGKPYNSEYDRVHNVNVTETGFNGNGDLYVVLETLDGGCFDVIEFDEGVVREL